VAGADPDALRTALADPAFTDRSRPRPELFGDGRAAERIVAALERLAPGPVAPA
jgi:UDP-N-acetylglucosamine 2-epimerase